MDPTPRFEKHTALFDAARCSTCERDVLLCHDIDAHGALVQVCVHCSQVIDPAAADANHRRVNDDGARRLGLQFDGDADVPEFEGCGKPNCNKGNCRSSGKKHPFSEPPGGEHP